MKNIIFYVLVLLCHMASSATAQQIKIINGSDAAEGEFPWIAALYYVDYLNPESPDSQPVSSQFCGGALIAPRYIVTAAHCVTSPFGGPIFKDDLRVVVGRNKLKSNSGYVREVDGIIIHHSFDRFSIVNDIALIRLTEEVPIAPLQIINTSESSFWEAGDISTIMGYGISKIDSTGGIVLPNILQKANVPIIADDKCENIYQRLFNKESMFCAGILSSKNSNDGVDSCFGDSGGPLVVKTNLGYRLVGIVSFGNSNKCISDTYPGVYTRVANFRSWILSFPKATPYNVFSRVEIDGLPADGETLNCINPNLGGDPIEQYTYQWFTSTNSQGLTPKKIPGATTQEYKIDVPLDSYVLCRVTAKNSGGSITLESGTVGPIKDLTPPEVSLVSKSCSKKSCKIKVDVVENFNITEVKAYAFSSRCNRKKCRDISRGTYLLTFDGTYWNTTFPRIRGNFRVHVNATDDSDNVGSSTEFKFRGR